MSRLQYGFRLGALIVFAALLSACTQSQNSVETALTQPGGQASTATTNVEATALAAENQASAAENVTEAQTSNGLSDANTPDTQVAALDTSNSLTFLPVEGAPTTAVTRLSKSLRDYGSRQGLTILAPTQPNPTYRVKGYFSALNDGSGTLVVYVWDVLDASGKRLHRINGQERSSASEANPWLAITDDELNRVADRTAARLKSWIDSRKS